MKINKLTKEQELKMKEYVDKYVSIGLRTNSIDLEKAIPIVHDIQEKILKRKKTPVVLLDSPLQAWMAVCVFSLSSGQVDGQVRDQVGRQVYSQVLDQLRVQVKNQVWDQVRRQVLDQVYGQVLDQVEWQVRRQVGDQVLDQVRAQVRSQVIGQVEDQLIYTVEEQVEGQVYSHVRSQVLYQVHNEVNGQVGEQVGDQVREIFKSFVWPYLDGCLFASFFSYYSFFKNELGVTGYTDLYEVYEKSTELSLIYPLQNICILSNHPEEIHMQDGVLHNESGPSVRYRDGFSVYSLWGIRVPEWVATTPAHELDYKKIAAIKNVDVRAVALKKYTPERLILDGHGEVIEDEWDTEGYKLIDLQSLFDTHDYAPHLLMKNPSVPGLVHCEGVAPECRSIQEAINWRAGNIKDEFKPLVLS